MALPERIRAEIEASLTGGPEPPSAADALAAGQRLLRRRRIGTAASLTVLGALVVRVATPAALHRSRSPRPPTQDAP